MPMIHHDEFFLRKHHNHYICTALQPLVNPFVHVAWCMVHSTWCMFGGARVYEWIDGWPNELNDRMTRTMIA